MDLESVELESHPLYSNFSKFDCLFNTRQTPNANETLKKDGDLWTLTIQDKFGSNERVHKWLRAEDSSSYETYFICDDSSCGKQNGNKAGVNWQEKWFKKPEEKYVEKSWQRDQYEWGVKEGEHEGRQWREEWHRDPIYQHTKSYNKRDGESWGHHEGSNPRGWWKEEWSYDGNATISKCTWHHDGTDGQKYKEESKIVGKKYWEETNTGNEKRSVNSTDKDSYRYYQVEGSGVDFQYTDKTERDTEWEVTTKVGHSGSNTWNMLYKRNGSDHFVHNQGTNEEGNWEEKFSNADEKWAHKTGNQGNESWEERWWEGVDGRKNCQKTGHNADNRWYEEWTELGDVKNCKKVQHWPSSTNVQEWEEYGSVSHGQFTENGVTIKDW